MTRNINGNYIKYPFQMQSSTKVGTKVNMLRVIKDPYFNMGSIEKLCFKMTGLICLKFQCLQF